MNDALIDVRNLSKSYAEGETTTVALDDVTFSLESGEFVAIMGPSGSGKSTLLHILGLLDRPSSGEYLLEGKSFAEFSDEDLAKLRNEKLGFVFQQFNLLPNSTVLENVMLPLLYSQIPESGWRELAITAVNKVGLTNRLNHQALQLSGGEKQRVAIARALINNPQVLFADEPTGNLDSKRGMEIMEFLVSLNQAGHTLILITHDPVMARFAKRIIQLKDGRVVAA